MSLASLRAGFARNKTVLAVLGAAAVAGLALVARKRASGDVSPASTTGSTSSGSGGFGTAAQAYALQPYDSGASDVYNALQPQIEDLQNRIPISGDLVEPSPAPTPNSLGVWAHYKDNGTGGAFYELFDDMTSRIVSAGEATVNQVTPKGRLNDEQFSFYAAPNPTDRYRYQATS